MLCCVRCCFRCFENLIEYIQKNAYANMAVSGDSYCTSAYHGMLLNLKHCSQFYFAVEFSSIFVFIGKVFITCLNVVTFYCIIRYGTHTYDKVESALGPIIMVAIFSFVMAHIFLCQFEEGTLAML